jgi:hypothetical protein
MTKTTKRQQAINEAKRLGVAMYGDPSYTGKCGDEDTELMNFHIWFCHNYPELSCLAFHCPTEWTPNGGTSYNHYSKKIKKGMKPRIADWILLGANGRPSLMVEFKQVNLGKSIASNERLEHFFEQLELLAKQKEQGCQVAVCLGFEAAKDLIDDFLKS